jgi:ribosome-associated heat shock protein Hsp15
VTVRVDRWLWAVRVYKTRTRATDACVAGHVRVNDRPVKPATKVGAGDVVSARRGEHTTIYEVVEPITSRVGATRAAECVIDRSPPRPTRDEPDLAVFARRDPGAGRPTKRDRRRIDRLRGRS